MEISVSKAFKKIIEQAKSQNHQVPKLPHTDKGLELENKHLPPRQNQPCHGGGSSVTHLVDAKRFHP